MTGSSAAPLARAEHRRGSDSVMSTNQSRNHGAKRRVRAFAAEHAISYQRAQQMLGYNRRGEAGDVAVAIGTAVDIEDAPRGLGVDYSLQQQATLWRPFADRESACVLIESMQTSMIGALTYAVAGHPSMEQVDVLMISTIRDPENYDELCWLTKGSTEFRHYVMANEHTGYAAAGAAAAALRAFRPGPRRAGVVILELQDPYAQVTDESNQCDFETTYRGTQWERHWRPLPVTEGPYWCESVGPGESVTHVLSPEHRRGYDEFLDEVEKLLRWGCEDRIATLVGAADNADLDGIVERFPVDRFGVRFSGALHLEYHHPPSFEHIRVSALREMSPDLHEIPLGDPSEFFWSGMNPKEGRVVVAHMNGEPDQLILLRDPPAVPHYWLPAYDDLRA
jgi:hypothetical protein